MVRRTLLIGASLLVFFQMGGVGGERYLPPLQASDGLGPRERIERMIQKIRGHRNISLYEMTVERPAWTRRLKIKVWDDRSARRAFVRILEPPKEQGAAFLRIGYNLWNYLPKVEKVMKIPPSMMLQPWMGSDFTNDDLVKESSYVDDYTHQTVGPETVDGEKTTRVDLVPLPHAPVVWGKVIFWVRPDDLPVRQQFLDEKGRVIKELNFSGFKTMDGVLTPTLWIMTPLLKEGQKTTLSLIDIGFDPPIPETVFTERNLRP